MLKKIIGAVIAVFFTWALLDFIGHGLIFARQYAAMPDVWRPQAEMKIGFIYTGVLITAASFVSIYAFLIRSRNLVTGLIFGVLFGLSMGSSLAFGGYAVHPIQAELAIGWFVLAIIENAIAGLIVGAMIRSSK
jgi:hypothetical protein